MELSDFEGILAVADDIIICFIVARQSSKSGAGEASEWMEEEPVEAEADGIHDNGAGNVRP